MKPVAFAFFFIATGCFYSSLALAVLQGFPWQIALAIGIAAACLYAILYDLMRWAFKKIDPMEVLHGAGE